MLSDRVRQILDNFGLSQNAFARALGISQSNVHAWLHGGNMPQTTAMAIQFAIGVRWQWLLNGEGEMLAEETGSLSDEERGWRDAIRTTVLRLAA